MSKTRRSPFNVAQDQVLHGVEMPIAPRAVAARTAAVCRRRNTSINRRTTCTELALRPACCIRASRRRQSVMNSSSNRQSANSARLLAKRVDLSVRSTPNQMQRIEYEVVALVGTGMTRNHFRAA